MSAVHTIERQLVDVTLNGNEADGKSAVDLLSDLCQHELPNVLSTVLSEFDDLADVIIIEHLEVEVEVASLEELTNAVRDAVVRSMRSLADTLKQEGELPGISLLDPHAAFLRAFTHFLRHGRMPWWYSPEPGHTIEMLVRTRLLARTMDVQVVNLLKATLQSSSSARHRLVRQLDTATVRDLISHIDPHISSILEKAYTSTSTLRGSLRNAALFDSALIAITIDALFSEVTGDADIETIAEQLVRTSLISIEAELEAGDRAIAAAYLESRQENRTPQELDVGGLPIRPRKVVLLEDADAIGVEGLFVSNAGVILLHPFLPTLFETVGLYANDQITNVSRAALLIHHLATGQDTAEEHEVVLAKVLCGIPIEYPLHREPPITEFEKQESVVLLNAAIEHWAALRNTSADGLRGNFLTRSGKLELTGSEWVLHVERQAFDVLLDHLPWSIGHVQLPWMRNMIRVEWPS